jgi:anti-anti-sigma factor
VLDTGRHAPYYVGMAEFTMNIETQGTVVIVRTCGYLDDAGGATLKETCEKLLGQGRAAFVFNLAQTPVINSTGLSMLLDLMVKIIDYHDGQVALTGLTKLTRTALQMTGVLTLGQSCETEAEAVSAVAG